MFNLKGVAQTARAQHDITPYCWALTLLVNGLKNASFIIVFGRYFRGPSNLMGLGFSEKNIAKTQKW